MTALSRLLAASLQERTAAPGEVAAWLSSLEADGGIAVEPRPLEDLEGWKIDPDTGDLHHASGRFFTVQGARVSIDVDGRTHRWEQPLIVQTDVGVLGLVAADVDGVLRFLVQAKMEPGNRRLVQVSPTVQATSSNFQRVHSGRATPHLDWFLAPEGRPGHVATVAHAPQSEQGTRYLAKRNLNAVTVVERSAIEDTGSSAFRWLTLGDLVALADGDDLLHMDTRSILGSVPVDSSGAGLETPVGDLLTWVDGHRARVRVATELVPLDAVGWRREDGVLRGPAPAPFEVVGVHVRAAPREVAQWDQPLVRNAHGTRSTLLWRDLGRGPEVLVAAATGPGVADGVELGPSLVDPVPGDHVVPLGDDTAARQALAGARIVLDASLPEEGGRFLHSSVQHVIADVTGAADGGVAAEDPSRRWASLAELRAVGARTTLLSMELRSLLAVLPPDLRGVR